MDPLRYMSQARYRIEKMRVFLLDKSENVIDNPHYLRHYLFEFGVNYPLTFKDIDTLENFHIFRTQNLFCRSIYKSYNDIIEECEIDNTFTQINYQTTPDGVYEFSLREFVLRVS